MTDTKGNGAVYSPARNSLDMISGADGTATTLLFSEKSGLLYTPQTFYDVSPPVLSGSTGVILAQMTPTAHPASPTLPTQGIPGFGIFDTSTTVEAVNTTTAALHGVYGMLSSMHPGGVVAVFSDGHTVFLRNSLDLTAYTQLLTSNSKWVATGPSAGSYVTNGLRVQTVLSAQKLISEADLKGLTHLLGKFSREGISWLFGMYVNNDPGNPERYLLNMFQSGLGLPDESYYREEKYADFRDA
jgi:hypothetical protein